MSFTQCEECARTNAPIDWGKADCGHITTPQMEIYPLSRHQVWAWWLNTHGMPTFANWMYRWHYMRLSEPRVCGALSHEEWDCVPPKDFKPTPLEWAPGVEFIGRRPDEEQP